MIQKRNYRGIYEKLQLKKCKETIIFFLISRLLNYRGQCLAWCCNHWWPPQIWHRVYSCSSLALVSLYQGNTWLTIPWRSNTNALVTWDNTSTTSGCWNPWCRGCPSFSYCAADAATSTCRGSATTAPCISPAVRTLRKKCAYNSQCMGSAQLVQIEMQIQSAQWTHEITHCISLFRAAWNRIRSLSVLVCAELWPFFYISYASFIKKIFCKTK